MVTLSLHYRDFAALGLGLRNQNLGHTDDFTIPELIGVSQCTKTPKLWVLPP